MLFMSLFHAAFGGICVSLVGINKLVYSLNWYFKVFVNSLRSVHSVHATFDSFITAYILSKLHNNLFSSFHLAFLMIKLYFPVDLMLLALRLMR